MNPFAPELPVTACADPHPFYRLWHHQFWLSKITSCAEWRDVSNHTRMGTIQSRTPEKKAKNHVTLTWKFPWKSCSTSCVFLKTNILSHILSSCSSKQIIPLYFSVTQWKPSVRQWRYRCPDDILSPRKWWCNSVQWWSSHIRNQWWLVSRKFIYSSIIEIHLGPVSQKCWWLMGLENCCCLHLR